MTAVVIVGTIACLHHNKVLPLCHDPEASCSSVHCGLVKQMQLPGNVFPSATPLPARFCVCFSCYLFVLIFAFIQELLCNLTFSMIRNSKDDFHILNHSFLHKPAQGFQDLLAFICCHWVSIRVAIGNQQENLSQFLTVDTLIFSVWWWKAHCASDPSKENLSYQLCIKLDCGTFCPTICPASRFTEHFNCL